MQQLMELVREVMIATVVTHRSDRSRRNIHQAVTHLGEVEALGGQVVSVTEPIDATTPIGQRVHQYRVEPGLPTKG